MWAAGAHPLVRVVSKQLSQVHFEDFVEWWGRFSESKLEQAWKKTKKGFFRGQPTKPWRKKELAARAQRAKMFAERVRQRPACVLTGNRQYRGDLRRGYCVCMWQCRSNLTAPPVAFAG
jgi:glutathione S-transferase